LLKHFMTCMINSVIFQWLSIGISMFSMEKAKKVFPAHLTKPYEQGQEFA
jgi:hypothetical protein